METGRFGCDWLPGETGQRGWGSFPGRQVLCVGHLPSPTQVGSSERGVLAPFPSLVTCAPSVLAPAGDVPSGHQVTMFSLSKRAFSFGKFKKWNWN